MPSWHRAPIHPAPSQLGLGKPLASRGRPLSVVASALVACDDPAVEGDSPGSDPEQAHHNAVPKIRGSVFHRRKGGFGHAGVFITIVASKGPSRADRV